MYAILEEFQFHSKLGQGDYGLVIKARHKLDDQYYAIKKIWLEEPSQLNEPKIMAALDHKNIVRYHRAFIKRGPENRDMEYLYIQMGCCKCTLKKLVVQGDIVVGGEDAARVFKQIVKGLDYMHTKDIAHGDLNETNIYVEECGNVRIGDFGEATKGANEETKQEDLKSLAFVLFFLFYPYDGIRRGPDPFQEVRSRSSISDFVWMEKYSFVWEIIKMLKYGNCTTRNLLEDGIISDLAERVKSLNGGGGE